MKRIIIVAAACFALAGCDKHDAEQAVLPYLKDPDSAKFGEFYYNKGLGRACLEVNSKNSMGGYAGSTPFELQNLTGWQYVAEQDGLTFDQCKRLYADRADP